jgi:hypothetical protein
MTQEQKTQSAIAHDEFGALLTLRNGYTFRHAVLSALVVGSTLGIGYAAGYRTRMPSVTVTAPSTENPKIPDLERRLEWYVDSLRKSHVLVAQTREELAAVEQTSDERYRSLASRIEKNKEPLIKELIAETIEKYLSEIETLQGRIDGVVEELNKSRAETAGFMKSLKSLPTVITRSEVTSTVNDGDCLSIRVYDHNVKKRQYGEGKDILLCERKK